MRTSPPTAVFPSPSALATYRALIDRLVSMDAAEFGGVDPRTLTPIPVLVLVLVKSRGVLQIQGF